MALSELDAEAIFMNLEEGVWYEASQILPCTQRLTYVWKKIGYKWCERQRNSQRKFIYRLKPASERPPFATTVLDEIIYNIVKVSHHGTSDQSENSY